MDLPDHLIRISQVFYHIPQSNNIKTRLGEFLLSQQAGAYIEIVCFFPVPGSGIYSQFSGYQSLSQLNFSPTWREDYEFLAHFRMRLYRNFLLWKMRYQTFKLLRQPFNFLFRNFETKMEMVPYRALKLKWLSLRAVWR